MSSRGAYLSPFGAVQVSGGRPAVLTVRIVRSRNFWQRQVHRLAGMVQTQRSIAQPKSSPIGERVSGLDWRAIISNLDDHGCATTEPLLTPEECTVLAEGYDSDQLFRSRIVMARHGFGHGEYKYFAYPLPQIVAELRTELYPRLAPIANKWNTRMGIEIQYPESHAEFIKRCHNAGQN